MQSKYFHVLILFPSLFIQTFCRFDYLEDDKMKTKIKVTNTKLGVCTFWSIVKFEDKLMQMRDLYQVTIQCLSKGR